MCKVNYELTDEREPERWAPVPISGFSELYQISTYGNVRSAIDYTLRVLQHNDTGVCVSLYNPMLPKSKHKTYSVARLVALAFIPNPDNLPVVAHKSDDKLDNYYGNIKWGTRKEVRYVNVKRKIRKVVQLSPELGIIVGVYDSVTDAAKAVKKISTTSIHRALSGSRHTAGGFQWAYEDKVTAGAWYALKVSGSKICKCSQCGEVKVDYNFSNITPSSVATRHKTAHDFNRSTTCMQCDLLNKGYYNCFRHVMAGDFGPGMLQKYVDEYAAMGYNKYKTRYIGGTNYAQMQAVWRAKTPTEF